MSAVLDNDPGSPRKLQELARHQMITKLYADILMDMQICELEGWDKMEFIRELQECLNRFTPEKKKEVHDKPHVCRL